ncbi:MAG TPA: hypothetical protein VM098_00430 [Phycisphaerae bacterium]|nr:hypothetical protein [Phycisphaerae bacterium]
MPGYKEMLELIRQGKGPEEILKTLATHPSRVRTLLSSKRLNQRLELEKDMSRKLAAYQLGSGIHKMIDRCRELAEEAGSETARKAAEGLLEQAKQRFDRAPSHELLVSLVRKGELPRSVLFEKGDERW